MNVVSSLKDDRRLAYRHHLNIPILYRVRHTTASERVATAENISRLGVLFGTDQEMKIGTPIELLMTMPRSIVGSDVQWYGRGVVVRIKTQDTVSRLREIAVQFFCYEILPIRHHFHLESWSISA